MFLVLNIFSQNEDEEFFEGNQW